MTVMEKRRFLFPVVGFLLMLLATGCGSTTQAASTNHNATSDRFNAPGNLLISDQFNNRAVEIAPDGHLVWSFGSGNPTLCNPGPKSIIGLNDAERLSGGLTLLAGTGIPAGSTSDPKGCADNRVIVVNQQGTIVQGL